MTKAKRLLFFLMVLIGFAAASGAEELETLDKAAEYFFYRCAGCHTVGGGKLTGPDLITATQWSSPDLKTAVKKMEPRVGSMTTEDIELLAAYLKSPDLPARISKQKQKIEARLLKELPPPSFETGQALFTGRKALVNGGVSCISCHRFSGKGGTLGPDLSLVKNRMPAAALQSAIENPAYKIMRPLYEKRKISKEEALHLAEYLSHPEKKETGFAPNLTSALGLGGAFFAAFLGLMIVLNQKIKRPARENLFHKDK